MWHFALAFVVWAWVRFLWRRGWQGRQLILFKHKHNLDIKGQKGCMVWRQALAHIEGAFAHHPKLVAAPTVRTGGQPQGALISSPGKQNKKGPHGGGTPPSPQISYVWEYIYL